MKKFKKDDCKCNNCKCNESLSKLEQLKAKKMKAVEGGEMVKKTLMPNGNIHFSK